MGSSLAARVGSSLAATAWLRAADAEARRHATVVAQDVLVVTAPGSGAEIIPFLKTWVNLPMAIGFTVIYAKVRSAGRACHGSRLLHVSPSHKS